MWFGAVIRGDNEQISIGYGTNVQENCIIHTDEGYPVRIGRNCTIGHGAIIHGCSIGDNCIIGMGAIILNGAEIGKNCMVGAGTLITEKKKFLETGKHNRKKQLDTFHIYTGAQCIARLWLQCF